MKKERERLRIVLLLDSFVVPLWSFRLVESILEAGYATVALVVLNASPDLSVSQTRLDQLDLFAYRIHRKLDSRLGGGHPDPFESSDLKRLLANVEAVETVPSRTKHSDRLAAEICELIRVREIDLGIRFGFRILRGDILRCTKFGIWSYHHGDERVNRGGPPGFWEVMKGSPVTGVTLQVLSEDLDGGLVLARTASTTDPTLVSRNKKSLYWNSVPLLPRMVKRLACEGSTRFFGSVGSGEQGPRFYSRRLYRPPGNFDFLKALCTHLSRVMKRKASSLTNSQRWNLLYKFQESGKLTTSTRKLERIVPPPNQEWADPFVLQKGDKYYVFFENLEFERGKAHISCITWSKLAGWSDLETVLKRDYHVSYPFVFQFNDQYFMIPETAEAGTIELFRAKDFPHDWELVEVLMTGIRARDTTLFYHDHHWWLFTCVQETPEMSSWQELFVYWSDELLDGEWYPHPMNPVVSDASSARPAGKIFESQGHYFRPSQNCGGAYGRSIKLNRIKELTKERYSEETVGEIEPLWDENIKRVHTLNFQGGLTVMDALVSEPRAGIRET